MSSVIAEKLPKSSSGNELLRAVELSEGVKKIVAIAAHVSRVGVNAIIMARRAGDLARGFGVLSNELRLFTQQVTQLMGSLSVTSYRLVTEVSALLQQTRSMRLLEDTQIELRRREAAPLVDKVLELHNDGCRRRMEKLHRLRRELSESLEGAQQLGQFGTVLARTALIEVTYGGTHAAQLNGVAKDFEKAIQQIVDALDHVRRTDRMNSPSRVL